MVEPLQIKIHEGYTSLAETFNNAIFTYETIKADIENNVDYYICQNFANRLLIAIGSSKRFGDDVKASDFVNKFYRELEEE